MKPETKELVSLSLRALVASFLAINMVVVGSFVIILGYDNLFVRKASPNQEDNGVMLYVVLNFDVNEDKIVRLYVNDLLYDRSLVKPLNATDVVASHIPSGKQKITLEVCDSFLGTPYQCDKYEDEKNYDSDHLGYISYLFIMDDGD